MSILDSSSLKKINKIVNKINTLEDKYASMNDDELRNMTNLFKEKIQKGESLDSILPDAFAVVREASKRVLGLRHYDVQLIGGIVLHKGNIAEMKTGEGKTLVAVCPAYLNALTGTSVHIITVNEYLAKRDKENMGKVFGFLGLTTGVISSNQSSAEKKAQYSCDIVYGTNSEFGFDYLRNNMIEVGEKKTQGELFYAIIDEADSILIDEARTPLIITVPNEKPASLYKSADQFAKTLKVGEDVNLNEKDRVALLTDEGINKAEKFFKIDDYMDVNNLELAQHITQALQANFIMKNNVDYIVQNSKVVIVDSFTGRIMPDKRFNQGLHQAIEAKENVEILKESKVCATITYQNLFRMYKKLSGMTGTAKTEEEEFKSIYKVKVIQIPTNKPIKRMDYSDNVYKTKEAKINALISEIKEKYKKGQPVLVGTASIESSEYISKKLKSEKIPHQILNAKHHEKEASIIAQAGRFKTITIATNMAGRGTDILLGGNPESLALEKLKTLKYSNEEIKLLESGLIYLSNAYPKDFIEKLMKDYNDILEEEKIKCKEECEKVLSVGGLCILGTERHESRRIDDQLRGRAGRQGDVGESKFFVSLEDDLIRIFGGEKILNIVDKLGMTDDTNLDSKMLTNSIRNAQKKVESSNFSIRKYLIEYDNVMNIQREMIYKERNLLLSNENLNPQFYKLSEAFIDDIIENHCLGRKSKTWNIDNIIEEFNLIVKENSLNKEMIVELKNKSELKKLLTTMIRNIYESKEIDFKDKDFNEVVRGIFLNVIDTYWGIHIDDMEQLKQGIGLRAIGQQEPTQVYANEGGMMFSNMNTWIRKEILNRICNL